MNIQNANQISEEDLEHIFLGKKLKKKSKAVTVVKYTLLFLFLAVAIFVSINYQALNKEISYWYNHNYTNSDSASTIQPTISNRTKITIPEFADNHILIPAISVDAPISWLAPNSVPETSHALENGAIHILGTSTPGTVGNVFITGHSSNYTWAPGSYKSLFALLDKLSIGDLVYVKYQNVSYGYKVYEKIVVKPSDTSVLEQTQKSILTLMTCTPIGTSLNRLIVKSNQIYPSPDQNSVSPHNQSATSLPSVR